MTATADHPLRALLPEGGVVTDPDVLTAHSRDRATFCPAGTPAVLVRARSTADVVEVLRWADHNRVPVVTQGARSGLSGAANAVDGCVLLSLEKMDRVLSVDPDEQIAVVQPGAINRALAEQVGEDDLFYPPDPGSRGISTIGGNVATNAGGMCCVKYGVTGDFVRGLEVVFAGGSVTRTGRRTAKGVAGYDLTRLLVGSEGTLGGRHRDHRGPAPGGGAPADRRRVLPDRGRRGRYRHRIPGRRVAAFGAGVHPGSNRRKPRRSRRGGADPEWSWVTTSTIELTYETDTK